MPRADARRGNGRQVERLLRSSAMREQIRTRAGSLLLRAAVRLRRPLQSVRRPSRTCPSTAHVGTGDRLRQRSPRPRGDGEPVGATLRSRPTISRSRPFAINGRCTWTTQRARRAGCSSSRVDRACARTYNFTSRFFLRGIGQCVTTRARPVRSTSRVVAPRRATSRARSLIAYKLNWQSVLFVGYGDDRSLDDEARLRPVSRQFFVKLLYAVQR